jgi:hypothetical protein
MKKVLTGANAVLKVNGQKVAIATGIQYGKSSFPAYELLKFLAKTGNTAAQVRLNSKFAWPGYFATKFEHIPPPVIRKVGDE